MLVLEVLLDNRQEGVSELEVVFDEQLVSILVHYKVFEFAAMYSGE